MTLNAKDLDTVNDLVRLYNQLKQFEEVRPGFAISWTTQAFGPTELPFTRGSPGDILLRTVLVQLKDTVKQILKETYDIEIN